MTKRKVKRCVWREESNQDYWDTSCNNQFVLIGGTPEDNGMKYCPYCGKEIKESHDER